MIAPPLSTIENSSGGKKNHVLVIGKIYADWCGHCVALKPEWAKLKRDIKHSMGRNFKNIHIEFREIGDTPYNQTKGITVDRMIEQFNNRHMSNSSEKLAIDGGYPTLFKLNKGKLEYYKGGRDAKSMFHWYTNGISSVQGVKKIHGGASSKPRRNRSFRKTKRATLYDYIFGKALKNRTQRRRNVD
jgi:thiol-disulfide isomerase/thioredoxin